jgi:chromosome segregation ATPase
MLLQDKTAEITLLNKEIALLKDQVKMHLDELHTLKLAKNEKEKRIGKLQIDIGSLKLQCDNLKTSLSKEESEKENLSSHVLKLRRALESKDGAKANELNSDVKVIFAKQIYLCEQTQ